MKSHLLEDLDFPSPLPSVFEINGIPFPLRFRFSLTASIYTSVSIHRVLSQQDSSSKAKAIVSLNLDSRFSLSIHTLPKGDSLLRSMDDFDKTTFGCELAERPMFVTIGGLKFPIGYRFCPTSEQLLKYYLKPKVDSRPLPAQVILELDAFQTNPWDLPGDGKERRFFFCKRKVGNGRRWNGMSESGCWKAKGKQVRVLDKESDQVIGVKRSLIFCEKKRPGHVLKHHWVMKEYRLVESEMGMQLEDWVVCKVYQKPHKTKYRRIRIQASDSSEESSVVDPREGDRHSSDGDYPQISSSSSSSSWVSEISSIESDQEETSPPFLHFVFS